MQKVVLITGASAGIRRATAIHLAQHGYKVYGAARRMDKLKDLTQYGIIPVQIDLNEERNISNSINQIFNESDKIDVLINSAGIGSYGALEDVPIAAAKKQLEINLFVVARLIQLVLPSMRNNGYGKIVNLSSIAGKVGLPLGDWYHASKFAIEGMSDCLRLEVKQFGVDVIIVEPGGTKSEMIENGTNDLMKFSKQAVYQRLAKK